MCVPFCALAMGTTAAECVTARRTGKDRNAMCPSASVKCRDVRDMVVASRVNVTVSVAGRGSFVINVSIGELN